LAAALSEPARQIAIRSSRSRGSIANSVLQHRSSAQARQPPSFAGPTAWEHPHDQADPVRPSRPHHRPVGSGRRPKRGRSYRHGGHDQDAARRDARSARCRLPEVRPGLREGSRAVRKYFTATDDSFGGIYLWKNRAAADAWFNSAWHARVVKTYGVDGQVTYFDAPLVIEGTNAGGAK
jgi:hypothetical protein